MFSGFSPLSTQDIRKLSAYKEKTLGSVGVTRDGRVYRYSLVGGTALAPGKLNVAATVDTNVSNVAVAAAAAIGDKKVVLDAGGAITADAYQDGTLNVNDATGEGISYSVGGNTATSEAAELTATLNEPVEVALVADTSEVTLTKNPWGGVVVSVADQADMPVGVSNITATAAYYAWIQTRGVCAVLADETIAVGSAVVCGSSTVGAVETMDTDDVVAQVGIALVAGVDTEYREVYLTID